MHSGCLLYQALKSVFYSFQIFAMHSCESAFLEDSSVGKF